MTPHPPDESSHLSLEEGRIVWRLTDAPPVEAWVQLGDQRIHLLAEADTGGGVVVLVETPIPFDLEIDTGFTIFVEHAPAGRTRYLLTYLDRTDVRSV